MPNHFAHRRCRSDDGTDQLPYAKAAAHRAVHTTIGRELKACYEVPRDLPHEYSIDAPEQCRNLILKDEIESAW